ncbi:MAG TPA: DUF3667 domain-containing protein, partial [Sphingomicrobium sp.]|nr:DUF3667 domain-containing protein [Sphingomicrobium sp.]
MSEAEGLAEAVTGGVMARAVEPYDGVDEGGHTTERACLNCGTRLIGDYCHDCGQRGHVHRSLGAFGHDLLHGVFHFEGKVWRTLPMLAWRPGELTRRYIDGHRASFVSPIALFLFCVFLMFAVLGWTGMFGSQTGENIKLGIENSVRVEQQAIRRLEAQRAAAVRAGQPTAELDRKLRGARDDLQATEAFRDRGELVNNPTDTEQATVAPWLRGPIQKIAKNPDLLIYKLKTNAYKFSWMLIPLSVPFMWLLVPFSRRYRLYDHTVFVTYSLCFMTLLGVLAMLLVKAGLTNAAGLLMFVPPFHWYQQLKGAYQLRWTGALWRTLALVLFTSITTSLFLLILF